ncbi:MAG: DUF4829 domain-containing protein [Oscillospiraceae bacterium]|jgi:predicted small secreted protein|nr:DUF4829 domain-containing protein [Oscillospiraceae bacterium]
MKRPLIFLFLLLLCISLSACESNAGKTSGAEIDYGSSVKFSEAEVKSAINTVLKKFKNFNGCDLRKIWYDEAGSDNHADSYMSTGRGSVNGVKRENVIILFSDFYAGSPRGDSGFNTDFMYTDWNWMLIRDSETDKWKVDDYGY